jgi:hypothetical protein
VISSTPFTCFAWIIGQRVVGSVKRQNAPDALETLEALLAGASEPPLTHQRQHAVLGRDVNVPSVDARQIGVVDKRSGSCITDGTHATAVAGAAGVAKESPKIWSISRCGGSCVQGS